MKLCEIPPVLGELHYWNILLFCCISYASQSGQLVMNKISQAFIWLKALIRFSICPTILCSTDLNVLQTQIN